MNLKEFEMLKAHYQKIIDYYNLPMNYYGVRLTERDDVDEYYIDHDAKMIWLKTHDIKEDDVDIYKKVIDCFKVVEKEFDYDFVIKSNTSFLINLLFVYNFIRDIPDVEHAVISPLSFEAMFRGC